MDGSILHYCFYLHYNQWRIPIKRDIIFFTFNFFHWKVQRHGVAYLLRILLPISAWRVACIKKMCTTILQNICLFQFNDKNTRKKCEISWKSRWSKNTTIKSFTSFWIKIINFEYISHLSSGVYVVDFEDAFDCRDEFQETQSLAKFHFYSWISSRSNLS